MSSWFWETMILAVVVVPVIILFGYAVFDVIRRDSIGVGQKALWLIAFCVFPIVGPLVYLVIRPPGSFATEKALAGDQHSRAAELTSLASLHDQGKLTDEEYRHVKEQQIYEGSGGVPGSVREQRGGQLL